MSRLSLADFKALNSGAKRSKYKSKAVRVDGKRFDSMLEADQYRQLKQMWQLGAIAWFIRQTPFELPGGVTYRADFLVVENHGGVRIIDCKGFMTALSKLKIAQVEQIYGIEVNIVKRSDVR